MIKKTFVLLCMLAGSCGLLLGSIEISETDIRLLALDLQWLRDELKAGTRHTSKESWKAFHHVDVLGRVMGHFYDRPERGQGPRPTYGDLIGLLCNPETRAYSGSGEHGEYLKLVLASPRGTSWRFGKRGKQPVEYLVAIFGVKHTKKKKDFWFCYHLSFHAESLKKVLLERDIPVTVRASIGEECWYPKHNAQGRFLSKSFELGTIGFSILT